MAWYVIAAIICILVGPFHALHVYNKAQERKAKQKKREENGADCPKDS